MKKTKIWAIAIICIVVILFFPLPIKKSFSGTGEVCTKDGEKIGQCSLSVELTELKSIVHCYRKSFSFVLDGNDFNKFESCHFTEFEHEGFLISQMYYDRESDRMKLCTLFYPPYFSHLELSIDEYKYILPIAVPHHDVE